jgi:hypothetical protein
MLLRVNGILVVLCVIMALAAPALAQQAAPSPCDSVTKNGDGDWVATRDVTIPGPNGPIELKDGNIANPTAEEWLNAHCR